MLALAASAAAQNKFSSSAKCSKPDKDYSIEVGDQPGHAYGIMQVKCIYASGEIAGIQVKEDVNTAFQETIKTNARVRFSGPITMANGDKVYKRGESTLVLNDGVPQKEEGKWSFNGGTGKFKSIKGKGTFKINVATDGTITVEAEGEYEIAK